MTDGLGWLSRRQRDGGIDRIALPAELPGSLWLCGKRAIAPELGDVPDSSPHSSWFTVVCLAERHELADRYPAYVRWLDTAGERAIWWPIPDMHAPPLDDMIRFADDLVRRLCNGDTLLVHCGAGIGRAGTVAVCVLIRLGVPIDDAERIVQEGRPTAGPEVGAQRDLVQALRAVPGTGSDATGARSR